MCRIRGTVALVVFSASVCANWANAQTLSISNSGARWTLGNQSVERVVQTKPFLHTVEVTNKLAEPARRHEVDSRGFVLSLDNGQLQLTAADFEPGKPEPKTSDDAAELVVPLKCQKHGVNVRVTYRLGRTAFYLHKQLEIDPGWH